MTKSRQFLKQSAMVIIFIIGIFKKKPYKGK